jgi:hypothetical protein
MSALVQTRLSDTQSLVWLAAASAHFETDRTDVRDSPDRLVSSGMLIVVLFVRIYPLNETSDALNSLPYPSEHKADKHPPNLTSKGVLLGVSSITLIDRTKMIVK